LEHVTYEAKSSTKVPSLELRSDPVISVPRVVWLASTTGVLLTLVYWVI
jgi:hypothetical protein